MSRLLDALKRIEDQQVPVPVVSPASESRSSASEQEIPTPARESEDTPEATSSATADTSAPPVDSSTVAEQSVTPNATTCPIEASAIEASAIEVWPVEVCTVEACTAEESTLSFTERPLPLGESPETVEIALDETTSIDVVTFDTWAPQWHDGAAPPNSDVAPSDVASPDDATTATTAVTIDDASPDSLESLATDRPREETPRVHEPVVPAQEAVAPRQATAALAQESIVAVQETAAEQEALDDKPNDTLSHDTFSTEPKRPTSPSFSDEFPKIEDAKPSPAEITQREPFHELAKNIVQQLPGHGPWVLAIVSAETDCANRPVHDTLAQTLRAHVDGDVLLVAEDTVSEDTVSEDTVSEDTVSEDTVSEDTVSEDTVAEDTVSEDTDDGFSERDTSRALPTLARASSAEHPGLHRLSWSDIDAVEASGETIDFRQLRDELPSTISLALIDAGMPGTARAERCLASCDGVYLMVHLGRTPRDAVRAARCWIAGCQGRLLGCIAQGDY